MHDHYKQTFDIFFLFSSKFTMMVNLVVSGIIKRQPLTPKRAKVPCTRSHYARPEKFENDVFTLETHQMFQSIHTTPELRGVASWLVHSTSERAIWVRALAKDTVLCFWTRRVTLTVPLSAQVYKWGPCDGLAFHPGGSRNIPNRFMPLKPG